MAGRLGFAGHSASWLPTKPAFGNESINKPLSRFAFTNAVPIVIIVKSVSRMRGAGGANQQNLSMV
jgi:hypothetical protein